MAVVTRNGLPVNHAYFKAYQADTAQNIATGSWSPVVYDGEAYDPMSWYTPGVQGTPDVAGKFLPSLQGWYLVILQEGIASLADGKGMAAAIYKNGAFYAGSGLAVGAANTPTLTCTSLIYLNGTTDYIESYVYHDHGFDRIISYGQYYSAFEGYYLGSLIS